MPEPSLRQLSDDLVARLAAAPTLDAADRDALERASAAIHAALGHAHGDDRRPLRDRVEAAAVGFEGTHPELTATLMQAAKILGDMGI